MTSPPRLIVFDLDGTLIDSRLDLVQSANHMLASYDAASIPEDRITMMIGEGARVLVDRVCAAAGLASTPPDALSRFIDIYNTRLTLHTRPYDGIASALEMLAGSVVLSVLTNKPYAPTVSILEAFGFMRFFDEVIGGDGPFPRKPDPAGLQALLAKAQAEPARAVLVGDSAIDIDAAGRAGVAMCLAGWGFGRHTVSPALGASCTWRLDSPLRLVGTLMGARDAATDVDRSMA